MVAGERVARWLSHPHDQLRVIVWRFDREQQHLAACLSTAESPTRARRSPSPLFGCATASTKRNVLLCHRQQRIDGSPGVLSVLQLEPAAHRADPWVNVDEPHMMFLDHPADLNHVVRKVRLALQNGVGQNHEHAAGDVSTSDIEPWL